MAVLVPFPTMHVLRRLCSRSPNDLQTTLHDFLTLYPRLLFTPDHSRSFWTVQNNREQSVTPRPSSPTSQDLPRPIPVLSRLPCDFPRPLPTTKVGKGRHSGRLSVTGALSMIVKGDSDGRWHYMNCVPLQEPSWCHMAPLGHSKLTHWGRDKMAAISQTTLSIAFSWLKMLEFRLNFHWSLFLRVQLTHWGWVTHICVSKLIITGSDNGLSPGRRQAIMWTNAGILLIGPLGKFNQNSNISIHENAIESVVCEMAAILSRPLCVNNTPALFQIMAWRRPGNKPLSEPMMVSLLTHICVTRPQWVNTTLHAATTAGAIMVSGVGQQ